MALLIDIKSQFGLISIVIVQNDGCNALKTKLPPKTTGTCQQSMEMPPSNYEPFIKLQHSKLYRQVVNNLRMDSVQYPWFIDFIAIISHLVDGNERHASESIQKETN